MWLNWRNFFVRISDGDDRIFPGGVEVGKNSTEEKTLKLNLKKMVLAAAAALTLTAAPASAEGEHFVFIYHSPDSDSWWNVIKNAISDTEAQMGVTVDIRNPPNGDLGDMARIIEQSAASNPDGIVVTIPDFDVVSGPIKDAIAKGIPTITVNSGTQEQSAELGALMHVGQPEYDAGFAAGKRAAGEGATNFVCVNHQINNAPLTERCRGFAEGMGQEFTDQMIDVGSDPAEVKSRVEAYLRVNQDIDAILAVGPNAAEPTILALEEMGLAGEINFGTFDNSQAIAGAIKSGTINYAIDQQPFLQGQLPIIALANFVRYGVQIPHNVNSGPGFITKDNIDQIAQFAGKYR